MVHSLAGALVAFAGVGIVESATCTRTSSEFNWEDTRYLVAFGDSYTYVQGQSGRQNYSFIGDYLPGNLSFTSEELLSNRIVQNFTGTAEGGPNWVEYLTGCAVEDGAHSPRDCAIQLWDFAFAGSDVSEALLPLHHNYTVPLVNQTQQFLTWAEPVLSGPEVQLERAQTLIAIWIGINDVNDSIKLKPSNASLEDFWELEVATMFSESVEPLFATGYRNFLFVNLPPLDRTAANQAAAEPKPNKAQVDLWDRILARHAMTYGMEKQRDGVKTMLYDANTFLNGVMDSPAQYGITNLTYCEAYAQIDILTEPEKYGCASLDSYFWYNSGHMTSHTHKIMVPDLIRYLKSQSTAKHART